MDTADPHAELLLQFDPTFNPPKDCGDERCHDLFPEFIYIVVIPISIAVFVIYLVLFSLLICCCVKRKKKNAQESEDQLACYDAVRRASISIRRMSTSNSTPLLDDGSRSGSMSLVRADHRRRGFRPRDSCHSAPGTLQRHHRNRDSASLQDTPPPPPAPPPYGVPQNYPMPDEEEVFLGPEIPLQDMPAEGGQDEAGHNDQQQQDGHRHPPHHHHRRHQRQRPYSAANGYTTH